MNTNFSHKKTNSKYKKLKSSYESINDSPTESNVSKTSSFSRATKLSSEYTNVWPSSSKLSLITEKSNNLKNKKRSSEKIIFQHKNKSFKAPHLFSSGTGHPTKNSYFSKLFDKITTKISSIFIKNAAKKPENINIICERRSGGFLVIWDDDGKKNWRSVLVKPETLYHEAMSDLGEKIVYKVSNSGLKKKQKK